MQGVIANNKYGTYYVPEISKHRDAAKLVLAGKVYEPNTIEFIRNNVTDGDIIHAGTYFGDFLPGISEKCTGIIWAFEPCEENFYCASQTITLNNITNVKLTNAALGDSTENVKLQVFDNDIHRGGMSMVVDTEGDEYQIAAQVKIDDIVPNDRKVDILQLDVEGYELQALRGAKNTIKKSKPIIIVETNCPEFLSDLGYTFSHKLHANFVYIYKN